MLNKQKTLVILSPGFPKNEADSTCLPPQQAFILAVKSNFPELNLIVLAFEYPFTTIEYEWNRVRIIPFNGWKAKRLPKLFIWFRIWKKLKYLKRQDRIIGIFSFWCGGCALIGKYFAKIHKLPHFCWILGQDARKNNRFIKWIRPEAKELVAMSDFLAREFFKNHDVNPAHIIPNGIDVSIYPSGSLERDVDVLGVGSLIPLKQYDLFLSVIKELSVSLPRVRSVICGKGPEESHLHAIIQENKLQNQVLLTGEQPHDAILQLMQRSRVFLHTSLYEGFSTVCLEALSAGAHVISFCKPMDLSIPHWHFSRTREEMLQSLLEILRDPSTDHGPVLPYSMSDSARAVMKLFD